MLLNSKYKLLSAASVTRDILYSFPNIKINLIIGISGSAPSLKHNIYLSDIIMGVFNNKKGSVI